MKSRIFCAIDTTDMDEALLWVRDIRSEIDGIKLGLEFFCANGAKGVQKVMSIAGPNKKLFLDLKFHDIPNTVKGAVKAILPLRPDFLTVHTAGGVDMMRAAKDVAGDNIQILGVTVLTHISDDNVGSLVEGRAKQAMEADLDGVICSGLEIENLREVCPADFTLMVPGIRPQGTDKGDQNRVLTPAQAIEKGADFLVIGRPITQASDRTTAAQEIVLSLDAVRKVA